MKRFLLVAGLNFGALLLGSILMGNPSENGWYQTVNKAPWTPPGWVFGAAWFTIMFLFSIFLTKALDLVEKRKQIVTIYVVHLVLNISWNPLFFRYHYVVLGMIILLLLASSLVFFSSLIAPYKRGLSLYLLPYLLWMFVALSLNGYIWLNN